MREFPSSDTPDLAGELVETIKVCLGVEPGTIQGTVLAIQVDEECSAEEWWEASRNCVHATLWARLRKGQVVLSFIEGATALIAASKLPGWDDGPEHAPCPLLWRTE